MIDDISYFVTGGMVMNAEKSLSSVSGPFSDQSGPVSDQDAFDVDWKSDASLKPFPNAADRLGSSQSFAWEGNNPSDLSSREPGFTGGYRFAGEPLSLRSSRSLMLGEKMNLQIGGQLSQWSVHDPYSNAAQYIAWAQQLFPAIPATTMPTEPKQPGGSAEALKILRSLWQDVQLERRIRTGSHPHHQEFRFRLGSRFLPESHRPTVDARSLAAIHSGNRLRHASQLV